MLPGFLFFTGLWTLCSGPASTAVIDGGTDRVEEQTVFREKLRLFIPDKQAKLYIPKNTGLNENVNEILRDAGVHVRHSS